MVKYRVKGLWLTDPRNVLGSAFEKENLHGFSQPSLLVFFLKENLYCFSIQQPSLLVVFF